MRIDADGDVLKRSNVNAAHAVAWRQRRLVFESTPLSDVIREFNP